MSDENEIKFPLYERYLKVGEVLYEVLRNEVGLSDYKTREFIDGLEHTNGASISKEEFVDYLKYLSDKEGDDFLPSLCEKIAKAAGVRLW